VNLPKNEQELNQFIAAFSPPFGRAPRGITVMKPWFLPEVALFIHPAYA
jgi:hypothetical protein